MSTLQHCHRSLPGLPGLILVIALVMPSVRAASAPAGAAPPALIQDPAVPMIQLPTRFITHRVNFGKKCETSAEIANVTGPGCIRHIWLLSPGKACRVEINVDGAARSQINMPLKAFFGVMHDLDDYFIDCAAFTVLPNPAAKRKDPLIPGTPGYNLWLPIPFQKSCSIKIHYEGSGSISSMVDWHEYDAGTALTPYRLHADFHSYKPAPERGGFVELANVNGEGFVAGVVVGYIQRNKSCMVYHTGGMTLLLDGETNPHVIRGCNVEDDFGFTWGFNDRQSRWIGCPWHDNRGRKDQDGVFYRFFGPDPISFRSSLVFRTGARGDNMESVVYTYRNDGTEAPAIQAPGQWQVAGLSSSANDWDAFQQAGFVEELPAGKWPEKLVNGNQSLPVAPLTGERGWFDLANVFFERHHTATPLTVLDHAAYARTTIDSDSDCSAVLRLAVDDWAIVWLNGRKIATLRHDDGLKTARIPVQLRKGANELLVKTNNSDTPPNNRLWVVNCVIESGSAKSSTSEGENKPGKRIVCPPVLR